VVGKFQRSDNPLSPGTHSCPVPVGPVGSAGHCSTGAAQGNGPVTFKVLNTVTCRVGLGGSGGTTPRTQSSATCSSSTPKGRNCDCKKPETQNNTMNRIHTTEHA